VSKTKQADGEIHEDQLRTFANRLDEEVSASLANNAEITAEDIYEVLVGACADGTLCLYALCVEPELTRWEHGPLPSSDEVRAGTARTSRQHALRKDLDELLPEQVEVCADLHLRPYYGDEDDTDGAITGQRSVEPLRSTPMPHSTRV